MSLTALYRQPMLLDRHQHVGKRIRRMTHFGLTGSLNACFLAASEFGEAAKEYVIGFVLAPEKDAQGRQEISPVAVFGLRDGENLYLAADGRWDARYIPAFLRRYPLAYTRGEDGQNSVVVDAASESFNDTEGELLIDPEGQATPFLQDMMKFMDALEQDAQLTRALCQRLQELDLLKPVQIDITLADNQKLAASGLMVIDEAKLKALPDATAGELLRNGALGILHAHLVSMSNVQRLTDRLLARLPQRPREAIAAMETAPTAPLPPSGLA